MKPLTKNIKRQCGVALITALLIVSLAALLATSLVEHLHYDIRRTENILRLDQAELYNNNAISFGRSLLLMDRTLNNEYDTLGEYSPANEQIFPVENGGIAAKILDLQSCFNLNNLSTPSSGGLDYRAIYIALLGNLEVDNTLLTGLADSLTDWLDDGDISLPEGAEFDYYIGLDTPYRTANSLMVSPSELRLVKGYTQEVIDKIKHHICVLPVTNTRININTASLEMLESISVLAPHASKIIEDRDGDPKTPDDDAPFVVIADFERYATTTLGITGFSSNGFQVYSEYFMMESHTRLGAGDISLFSLINRNQSDGTSTVVHQSRGTL